MAGHCVWGVCGCGWVCVWFGFEKGGEWEGCYALVLSVSSYTSLHKELLERLSIVFNRERLQIRTRGGLKTRHNFQHTTFPWHCTLINMLKETKRKCDWGTGKTHRHGAKII